MANHQKCPACGSDDSLGWTLTSSSPSQRKCRICDHVYPSDPVSSPTPEPVDLDAIEKLAADCVLGQDEAAEYIFALVAELRSYRSRDTSNDH